LSKLASRQLIAVTLLILGGGLMTHLVKVNNNTEFGGDVIATNDVNPDEELFYSY